MHNVPDSALCSNSRMYSVLNAAVTARMAQHPRRKPTHRCRPSTPLYCPRLVRLVTLRLTRLKQAGCQAATARGIHAWNGRRTAEYTPPLPAVPLAPLRHVPYVSLDVDIHDAQVRLISQSAVCSHAAMQYRITRNRGNADCFAAIRSKWNDASTDRWNERACVSPLKPPCYRPIAPTLQPRALCITSWQPAGSCIVMAVIVLTGVIVLPSSYWIVTLPGACFSLPFNSSQWVRNGVGTVRPCGLRYGDTASDQRRSQHRLRYRRVSMASALGPPQPHYAFSSECKCISSDVPLHRQRLRDLHRYLLGDPALRYWYATRYTLHGVLKPVYQS